MQVEDCHIVCWPLGANTKDATCSAVVHRTLVFHLVSAEVSARLVYCRGLGPYHLLPFSSTPRFHVKSLNVSA